MQNAGQKVQEEKYATSFALVMTPAHFHREIEDIPTNKEKAIFQMEQTRTNERARGLAERNSERGLGPGASYLTTLRCSQALPRTLSFFGTSNRGSGYRIRTGFSFHSRGAPMILHAAVLCPGLDWNRIPPLKGTHRYI